MFRIFCVAEKCYLFKRWPIFQCRYLFQPFTTCLTSFQLLTISLHPCDSSCPTSPGPLWLQKKDLMIQEILDAGCFLKIWTMKIWRYFHLDHDTVLKISPKLRESQSPGRMQGKFKCKIRKFTRSCDEEGTSWVVIKALCNGPTNREISKIDKFLSPQRFSLWFDTTPNKKFCVSECCAA